MTNTVDAVEASMIDTEKVEREDDIELLHDDEEQASAENFPRRWNLSAGSLFNAVLRAREPLPPEYVSLPLPGFQTDLELVGALGQ
ncbi:hypothetical protein [Amycolatopsis circi]|uniref:hypothetical protein n=1 Tax=Amycolatopsis circi TaxID=871959 RepID=UPI000E2803BE|nr:hypothetical protein [Amycolatopsis circi]